MKESNTQAKAREFWIDEVSIGRSATGAKLFGCSDAQHERTNLHVIEFSAYQALAAELAAARDEVDRVKAILRSEGSFAAYIAALEKET